MKHVHDGAEANGIVNQNLQAGAWQSFPKNERDAGAELDQQYRELIKEALWRKETSESFHSFVEAIQWSPSA